MVKKQRMIKGDPLRCCVFEPLPQEQQTIGNHVGYLSDCSLIFFFFSGEAGYLFFIKTLHDVLPGKGTFPPGVRGIVDDGSQDRREVGP